MLSNNPFPARRFVKPAHFIAAAIVILGATSSGYASNGAGSGSATSGSRPEATCPAGGQCFADVLSDNAFYEFINRIYMQDLVTGYPCGGAGEPCDAESRPYYRPGAIVTRQQMAKFIDNARRLPQINITVASGSAPIRARNDTGSAIAAYSTSGQAFTAVSDTSSAIYAQTTTSAAVYGFGTGAGSTGLSGSGGFRGVYGSSTSGDGVHGSSSSASGVLGVSTNGAGVRGTSTSGYGVYGYVQSGLVAVRGEAAGASTGVYGSSTDGTGVYGSSTNGEAGVFAGNVQVTGNLSKGGGSFKIDHPLDPSNQYLYHSFVESPDMMNVYNGNVTTNDKGEATIELPEYFQALNRDFRYQLTTIGQQADAWVASEIQGNRFTIRTDKPNVKVSWQVTGIRQDPYANEHRIPVEEAKPTEEQGKYLHPEAWGQPASLGVEYETQQRIEQMSNSR